ncbi:hypothetical protein BDU57DRAFT_530379 [Ampelomyces quisqualis]|uniref:Uncharacterized protein n=1 Tax=Ampelomyces quisqualis TaxID=50730 RepID=A0A6A5QIV0_AMPQU|nr:hypothetical protein BDU57DRAFT_530379 [Ampelomyces quisqualis]
MFEAFEGRCQVVIPRRSLSRVLGGNLVQLQTCNLRSRPPTQKHKHIKTPAISRERPQAIGKTQQHPLITPQPQSRTLSRLAPSSPLQGNNMSTFLEEREEEWEEVRRAEVRARDLCNAWQYDVERSKKALDQAKGYLWPSPPAWMPTTEQQRCKGRVKRCKKRWLWAIERQSEYLEWLKDATDVRKAHEEALAETFEEMRQEGEMSSTKTALERRFVGKKEWICRPGLVGRRGFFELDRTLDALPSIRRRLVGSCLFMYE